MLKLKAVSVLLVIAGVVCWRPNLVAHKRLSAISFSAISVLADS